MLGYEYILSSLIWRWCCCFRGTLGNLHWCRWIILNKWKCLNLKTSRLVAFIVTNDRWSEKSNISIYIWWIRWYSDLQYLWMDEMRSNGKKRMRMSEGERCYLAECQRERDWSTMVSKVTMHKNIFHKRPQMSKSIGRNGWNRSNWYSTWVIVKLMYDYDILYPTPRIQLSVRSFVCPNFYMHRI